MFRSLLVNSLILVIFVNQVCCSFTDFIFKLPLKISDGVASLARMFEENFKYHSPKARQSYKRSDLLSKIQNSFKAEETTTVPPPTSLDPALAVRDIDEELRRFQPSDSKRLAEQDLEIVVPLNIPYIPQPRSGMQEFFRSVQPLANFGDLSVKAMNSDEHGFPDLQSWHISNVIVNSKEPETKSTTNKGDLVIDLKKFRVKISSDVHFSW